MVAFKIDRGGYKPAKPAPPARSPRRRVLLTGQFQSLTHSWPATIRNLSCTGAAIECDGALKVGGEGVLRAGSVDCLCRVVWNRGRLFGLRFDRPLPNPVVLELHRITEADVAEAKQVAAKEYWFKHHAD